jgi:pyridoxine 5-phosphate synthase
MQAMPRLGVNIDHVATLRQARGGREPDPVQAAVVAELAGADGITIHLREDRRHIQDRDLRLLRESIGVILNLEMSLSPEILELAIVVRPDQLTFVPERRAELTTEGGLDVVGLRDRIAPMLDRCREHNLIASLFIDPDPAQVEAAIALGVDAVELHTGRYANAAGSKAIAVEFAALRRASEAIVAAGIELHAGHGLTLKNTGPIAAISGMKELNIGHAIVARAVFVGLDRAVREMKDAITAASATNRTAIAAG